MRDGDVNDNVSLRLAFANHPQVSEREGGRIDPAI